jgi:DNA-binding XRE family transcriptional regulator
LIKYDYGPVLGESKQVLIIFFFGGILFMDGLEIKIQRLTSGLKGYELARQVGITPDKMSQIESGRTIPSAELLERILLVIGKPRKNEKTCQEGK